MKCRCAWNDASSRPNRSSRVPPSSLISSPRPRTPSRRCRLLAEMSLAVVMIERSGRTNRPAISQPAATDNTAMIANATTMLQNADGPTVRGTRVGGPAVTAPGRPGPPAFCTPCSSRPGARSCVTPSSATPDAQMTAPYSRVIRARRLGRRKARVIVRKDAIPATEPCRNRM